MKLNEYPNRYYKLNLSVYQIYDNCYDQIFNQIRNQIDDHIYWEIRDKIYNLPYLKERDLYETK